MTWTTIPDSNIEPGKAVRSVDMIAMRDNIQALANGDPGAPRIIHKAIKRAVNVLAGDVPLVYGAAGIATSEQTSLTSGVALAFGNVPESLRYARFVESGSSVLSVEHNGLILSNCVRGTVRMKARQYGSSTWPTTLSFKKNGTTVASWTSSSGTWTYRSFDVAYEIGDYLTIEPSAISSVVDVHIACNTLVRAIGLPVIFGEDANYV